MIRLKLVVLFVLCVVVTSAAQTPILVQERAGIDRSDEPVTLGIPFAKGSLSPATAVRITSGAIPINAQFMPMAFWDDGSIRWLKCDFQAFVPANSTANYTLETNAAFTPSTELTADDNGSIITVTTGPLRFTISKTAFNLFDQVWLDSNGDRIYDSSERIISSGSTGPVVGIGANSYPSSMIPPDSISIEEQGPVKVVVKVTGRHFDGAGNILKYETRIYAYAGKPYVKVWHVYANGKSVSTLVFPLDPANGQSFDRYAIDLHLNLSGNKTARLGGDSGAEFTQVLASGDSMTLLQQDRTMIATPLSYTIRRNGNTVSSGSRAEGWADLSNSNRGLLISSRYFWQKYPKGISLAENGDISIEPTPTPEFLYVGMGTGDDLLFYFHSGADASQAGDVAMALNKNPLVARATPAQYAGSGAVYNLLAGPSTLYPQMDAYASTVTANHLANREPFSGNINFGAVPYYDFGLDANNIDQSTWGGNYYDAGVLTTARLFMQTGDARHADVFTPAAWHFMETAAWNTYDPTDWLNGFNPSYGEFHRGTSHFEQHYGEGLWYYYYLTGDERAREIGLRAADSIMLRQDWGNNNVNCRLAYQRASAVLEAYKNTRNPAYLAHVRHLLITKLLDTQDTYGVIGSTDESGNIGGEQVFMMALYSDTLWKYIREMPANDPERPQFIAKLQLIADFFDLYARKSPGVESYWNFYGPPPNNAPPQHQGDDSNPDSTVYWDGRCLMAGTYAYVYDLTGNSHYRDLAVSILNNIWIDGTQGESDGSYFWSKVSGQTMKNMLHAVAIVEGNITPPNQPPIANAGADQIVDEATVVALSGSGFDPEGGALTYEWSQVAGTAVTLADPFSAATTFTAPQVTQPEALTFRLRVTDDGLLFADDTVTIVVQNQGQSLLFFDDFEDGDASDWNAPASQWSVVNGDLRGTTTKKTLASAPFTAGCSVCTFDTSVRIETAGGRASLLGWYVDKKTLVEVALMEDRDIIVLTQKSGGRRMAKAKAFVQIAPNTDYRLAVSYDGSTIAVTLDGATVLTVPTSTAPIGGVGFRVKSTRHATVSASFAEVLAY